jgi:hypothetical protein
MRERGWSRVRLFEEIGAELGYAAKSRSGFLPLLSDREPTEAQAAVLRRHFGEPAPTDDSASGTHTPEAGSLAELVEAMRAQTEAITRLVATLETASTAVLQGQSHVAQLVTDHATDLEAMVRRHVDERLSLHPTDDDPGRRGGSSPSRAGRPSPAPGGIG